MLLRAQCPAVEFSSARTLTTINGGLSTGAVKLAPGSFLGLVFNTETPPFGFEQMIPSFERHLLNCYQRSVLGNQASSAKDYSAGASSTVGFLGALNANWRIGAVFLGYSQPYVHVVTGAPPATIQEDQTFALPGQASTGMFVDVNKDGNADMVVLSTPENAQTGSVSILLGKADGTFQGPVSYATGSYPGAVAAGDFNGDGNIDLVVVGGGVSILLGNGDGTFGPATAISSVTAATASVAVADLNGDGKLDLVVAGPSSVAVWLGNGDGSFRAGTPVAVTDFADYIAVGDFNLDGKADIAVAYANSSTIGVRLGNGDGTFGPENRYIGPYDVDTLVITDVNGDGKPDILVAQGTPNLLMGNADSDGITTLLGNGDGTFQDVPLYAGGFETAGIVLADINGDGKPDIVADNSESPDVDVFLNNGNGTFAPAVKTQASQSSALAAADVNGDGKMDVVLSNGSVLLGNGTGAFTAGTSIPGVSGGSIVSADFNGDGKTDVVIGTSVGFTAGSAVIALNAGNGGFAAPVTISGVNVSALAVGDFNRDGKMDLAIADGGTPFSAAQPGAIDILLGNGNGTFRSGGTFPAGVNPAAIAVGDLNRDGVPDLVISTADANSNYQLAVLIGNGDGTFKAAAFTPTDFGPAGLAITDLNGDGNNDVVVMHCCGDTDATYLLGNGDGTLQPEVHFNAGPSPINVIAADINGDGKPDLIVADHANSGGVAVLLNETATAKVTAVSAAAFQDIPLAMGSIATAFGSALSGSTATATKLPLPTQLGGTNLSLQDAAGATVQAPLFYASPTQINFEVPTGIAAGTAHLAVAAQGGPAQQTVQVTTFAPALFTVNSDNLAAGYLQRFKSDGSMTTEQIYQVSSSNTVVAKPITLPAGNEHLILTLFGTGLRNYANTFLAAVGEQYVTVQYAGSQGSFVGLDQVNIQLTSSLPSGTLPVEVGNFGGASNTVYITIQ